MFAPLTWGVLGVAVFLGAVWWGERDTDWYKHRPRGGPNSREARDDDFRWSGRDTDGDDQGG